MSTADAVPDPSRCPLCGAPNGCAIAAGSPSPCWCASVLIGAEVLDRIPAAARGVACVCARCASGTPEKGSPATS